MHRFLRSVSFVAALLLPASLLAGFAGTDIFLPAAGRVAGAGGSQFYTTVWVTNPSTEASDLQITFFPSGHGTPVVVNEVLQPGASRTYENIAESLFQRAGVLGGVRFRSTREVLVSSRIYNQQDGTGAADSEGVFFGGVPATFGVGSGEGATLQGVSQNTDYRYNFFMVEVTGKPVQVSFDLIDHDGTKLGAKTYSLKGYDQLLVNVSDIQAVALANGRLEAKIGEGEGRLVIAGSLIANGSQDSTGFEMSFNRNLLASNSADGSGGVASLNGLKGPIDLAGGSNVHVTASGSTITLSTDAIPGPPGPTGSSGPAGVPGAPGTQGAKGEAGAIGPQGASGAQGPKGDSGATGATGATGPTGPQGVPGTQGAQGDPGATGAAGATGAQGVPGAQGLKGDPGVAGATGATGPQGDPGATGAAGVAGPQGAPGAQGSQGNPGPAGPQGVQGPQGNPGSAGSVGPQGPAGPQGDPGVAGAAGPQGNPGAQGPQGNPGSTGGVGPQGPAGAQGPQGTPGSNGTPGAAGPQGPQGPAGAQGPQGTPGSTGTPGAAGPQGPQGAAGPAGPKGLSWLGPWSSGSSYAQDDAVSYAGGSWISLISANSNITPGSDPTKWSPLASKGDVGPAGPSGAGTQRVYRWNTFNTYDQAGGWNAGNSTTLFGGINPSIWTDNNGAASQMSSDKEVLRTLFVQKAYPGLNAMVYSGTELFYSSTNGRIVAALFRVQNTTGADIAWSPQIWYSCYSTWGELASVAINGVSALAPNCAGPQQHTTVSLTIPNSRTSTVIFISSAGMPSNIASGITSRSTVLAFDNNSLALPAGLQLVDDLDVATGDYSQ